MSESRISVRRTVGAVLLLGMVAAGATAIWLQFQAPAFRATAVVVPVGGQRSSISLPGVASLLGATIRPGSSGFEATQDVVAYLLRSRAVLMAVAAVPAGGRN